MPTLPRPALDPCRRSDRSWVAGLAVAAVLFSGCAQVPPANLGPNALSHEVAVPAAPAPAVAAANIQADRSSAKKSPSATPKPPKKRTTTAIAKVNCRKKKCIALTFDDGPGPFTKKLLATLARTHVRATFFMLGKQVHRYPKVARAVAVAGHSIGVHTWDHRSLPLLSNARIAWEINSTVRIIKKVTKTTPDLLRPPYGATNSRVALAAKRAHLGIALWNVDTLDWKYRNSARVTAAAVRDTRRGSIILVHDIHPTTVAAIPSVIERLRRKGYTFVTVEQLVGKPKPGQRYRHG